MLLTTSPISDWPRWSQIATHSSRLTLLFGAMCITLIRIVMTRALEIEKSRHRARLALSSMQSVKKRNKKKMKKKNRERELAIQSRAEEVIFVTISRMCSTTANPSIMHWLKVFFLGSKISTKRLAGLNSVPSIHLYLQTS